MKIDKHIEIKKRRGIEITLFAVFSFCFVQGINYYFFSEDKFGNESIFNILFFIFAFIIQGFPVKITKKIKKTAYYFGFLISSMLVIGKAIYDTNVIFSLLRPISNIGREIITLIGFTVVFGAIISILFEQLIGIESTSNQKPLWKIYRIPYMFFILWGVIFITWIPCFLAYYPGVFSYDIPTQMLQVVQGISFYTKFHPPLHTMILAFCLFMQSILGFEAISIYAITQMILFAGVLSKLVMFLIEKKLNNYLILLSLLFVSINPVVAIFSILATKDVYFAVFYVLSNIYIVRLIGDTENFLKKKSNFVCLGISILLSCLFRNNAIYVFVIVMFVYLLAFKKKRKQILFLFMLPIIVYLFINSFVYGLLGIGEGNNREILSVPIQQIANVMVTKPGALSEELINEVNQYIPYDTIDQYNPRFADPIKKTFRTNVFNENKIEFLKLWAKLLVRYPDNYINAFLTLNIPYWYTDASTLDRYSNRMYMETNICNSDYYTFQLDSKLPTLYGKYQMISSYKFFENKPILSNLFSIATPIWLIISTIFVLYIKNKRKGILILAPSILLWLTYLLGPVSNFRYISPLFLLYPIFVALIFNSKEIIKEE